VVLKYSYCDGKETCASGEEMEEFMNEMTVDIIIGDKWFNQTSYDQPIQSYFTEILIPLFNDTNVFYTTHMQNNTLHLYDTFFGIGS